MELTTLKTVASAFAEEPVDSHATPAIGVHEHLASYLAVAV